jgi:hypothetical protein
VSDAFPVGNAFDEIADLVHAVVSREVPGTTVAGLPRADPTEQGVDVCLLGVTVGSKEIYRRHQPMHRLPVQLEFLVAVAGPARSVPGVLHDLCAAIDATGELELASQPVPIDWWVALGVVPRPAVRVLANTHVDRLVDAGPLVTDRIRIEAQVLDGAAGLDSGRT